MKSRPTRHLLRASIVLSLCLIWLLSTNPLVPQVSRTRATTLAFDSVLGGRYQRAIDSTRTLRGFKGVSAAVLLPDQGVWQGVSGVSYGSQAITPDMKFDIASNTKSFVSTMILQLAEEGLLSLDDTLGKYLPPLPNITPSVTIRQLLNMTSGLSDQDITAVEDSIWANPSKNWTLEQSIATFVGPPVGKPGGPFMYCNTNYILLGMVIRQITASTLSSQIRQRILIPVSLDSTYFGGEETFSGPIAHPWYYGYGDISSMPRNAMYTIGPGAGGIVSTAADMARGVKALFEGSLIAPSSLEQMRTCVPIPPEFKAGNFPGLELKGYGLGVIQAALNNIPVWGNGGHGWGYRSFMAYDTTLKAGFAAFINQSPGDPEELVAVLLEASYFSRIPHISLSCRAIYFDPISDEAARIDTSFMVRNAGGGVADSISVTLNATSLKTDSAIAVWPHAFVLAPGDSQKVNVAIFPRRIAAGYYAVPVTVTSRFSIGAKSFPVILDFEKTTVPAVAATALTTSFALEQNFPNPFNPRTVVSSQLPVASNVRIVIYDVLGREVAVLVNEKRAAGTYEDAFDATGLASGVYIYRFTAGSFVQARKMLLEK